MRTPYIQVEFYCCLSGLMAEDEMRVAFIEKELARFNIHGWSSYPMNGSWMGKAEANQVYRVLLPSEVYDASLWDNISKRFATRFDQAAVLWTARGTWASFVTR